METVTKKLEELQALHKDQARLMGELARSLKIRALWPEAFEHGSVKSSVIGNPRRVLTFIIIRGNGTRRGFELSAVPLELWPAQVLEDMKRPGANPEYKRILKGGNRE